MTIAWVVGAPDLGVSADNAGSVVLSAHDGRTDKVRTAHVRRHEALGGSIAGNDDCAVGLGSHIDELLHEGLDSRLVSSVVQVRLADQLGSTRACDLESTARGRTVGKVDLELESIIASGGASALDVSLNAIRTHDTVPEDESLTGLGKKTIALGVEVNVLLARLSESSVGESGHGEVDPLVLRGHGKALATAGNSLDLLGRANTRVDEKSGSGESTSSEDNSTTGLDLDDLAGSRTRLDLNTGNLLTLAHNSHNLAFKHELEVGVGLSNREVITDGASTLAVGDHHRRMSKHGLLLVGLSDGVDLAEAVSREELAQDIVGSLVNQFTVFCRAKGTGSFTAVEPPNRHPAMLAVSVQYSEVSTLLVVKWYAIDGTSYWVVVSFQSITALPPVELKETLRNDNSSRSSADDNVVVGHVGDNGGEVTSRWGRTTRARARSSSAIRSHSSPGLVVSGLGRTGINRETAKASTVVVESTASIGRIIKSSSTESKSHDSIGISSLESSAVGLDTSLAEESEGERVRADLDTLLDGLDLDSVVIQNIGVCVSGSLADGGNNLAVVGPSNDEKLLAHGGTHTNGGISFGDGSNNLTNKIGAGLLRHSDTEAELAALVDELLEGDSGVGILVFLGGSRDSLEHQRR
ncbi:hypothetical protein HG531_001054 [Fusarium graminearum]|nr:hypothetical protein HG531_001054 [Fusarium graminearum]